MCSETCGGGALEVGINVRKCPDKVIEWILRARCWARLRQTSCYGHDLG